MKRILFVIILLPASQIQATTIVCGCKEKGGVSANCSQAGNPRRIGELAEEGNMITCKQGTVHDNPKEICKKECANHKGVRYVEMQ